MNLSKILLAASVVLLSCDSDGPVVISAEGFSYFPLEIGNRWEYEPIRQDMPQMGNAIFTIVSNEIKEGKEYFAMERVYNGLNGASSIDTIYYRTDAQGFVFELSPYDNVERNRFRLGAEGGETWNMTSFAEQDYIVTTSITDVTLNSGVIHECKSFGYDVPQWADEEHYVILAKGIGIVQQGGAWGFDYRLKSARIGGAAF